MIEPSASVRICFALLLIFSPALCAATLTYDTVEMGDKEGSI